MAASFTTLVRIELRKIRRRRFSVWVPGFMAAVLTLIMIGYSLSSSDSSTDVHTGWVSVGTSLQWSINWGYLLLLVYAAQSISGEKASGTLTMVLTCPVNRIKFFLAKLVALEIFGVLVLTAAVLAALIAGSTLFGLKEVSVEGLLLVPGSKLWIQLARAVILSVLVLLPLLSLGLLISSMTDGTTSSVLAAVALFILLRLLLENVSSVSPYLFNSYLDTQFEYLSDLSKGLSAPIKTRTLPSVLVPLVYFMVLAPAGAMIFKKKDIQ